MKEIVKKHAGNFTKYLVIGIIWTLLNIFLMWLFIDVIKFTGLIGSTIVVVILFFGKYYAYLLIGLIIKGFLKYASTVISFSVANVVLIWLAVDIMKFDTVVSSAIIAVFLFLLRFIVLNLIGLVKNGQEN